MTSADAREPVLHVVATIPVRHDALDDARDVLRELVDATRQEEGCVAYDGYVSQTDEATVLVTVEQWRAEADLDAHMTTPHIARAFERVGPLLDGDVAIHRLQAL